jgi:hypothetical protein
VQSCQTGQTTTNNQEHNDDNGSDAALGAQEREALRQPR